MRVLLGIALAALGCASLFTFEAWAQDPPKPAQPEAVSDDSAGSEATGAAEETAPVVGKTVSDDPTLRDLNSYRLRVGDQVDIVVYQFDNLRQSGVTVPANGDISFTPVGKINLLGKTVFEVEETIAQRLKDGDFVTDPHVGCIVTQYAPRTASIIGAISTLVNLPVHKNVRIIELLAQAGALDQNGSADYARVEVQRVSPDGTTHKIPVNVDQILRTGLSDQNLVIFEGDIIWVPRLQAATPQSSDWVYVLGQVNSPGRHPIIQGRTPFTLTKLIAIVGDFKDFADRGDIKLIRQTDSGRTFKTMDFDEIIEGNEPDFVLQPDDLIFVPERFF